MVRGSLADFAQPLSSETRHSSGVRYTRLSAAQRQEIIASGERGRDIARRLGVSDAYVSKLRRRGVCNTC
jgi:DNA-binding CsgD family transcriptional regulator